MVNKILRPMLAGSLVSSKGDFTGEIKFPCYASAKLDGYRCLISDGKAWTRSGKLHPSPAVQRVVMGLPNGLDGELTVPGKDFNIAGGLLRREDYTGPLLFTVFDFHSTGTNFRTRYDMLQGIFSEPDFEERNPEVRLLQHYWIENLEQLEAFEQDCLANGFEGICIRAPYGMYKEGRGTLKDQTLLKLKRWNDGEARVLSVEPRMENCNPDEKDAFGHAKRSSAREGLVETNILGKLNVVGLNGEFKDKQFSIGGFYGLTDDDKRIMWEQRAELIGMVCKYHYLGVGNEGKVDRPRHPLFLDWRSDWDTEGEENEKK